MAYRYSYDVVGWYIHYDGTEQIFVPRFSEGLRIIKAYRAVYKDNEKTDEIIRALVWFYNKLEKDSKK